MNQLAQPAATPLNFPSIGVEVEDALFLDETDADERVPRGPDGPSPFELFADENALVPRSDHATRPSDPPDLFKHYSGSGTSRSVSLIALFVLVAATMTFVTLRGWVVSGDVGAGVHAPAP